MSPVDPPDRPTDAGSPGGPGKLDLPLGPATGRPRMQSPREPVYGAARRSPRRWLRLLLLLSLIAGAAALYWFVWAPPRLTPSVEVIDHGSFKVGGTSEPRTLTFANTGRRPLVIENLELVGTHAADFRLLDEDCLGVVVGRLAVCTLRTVFAPSGPGPREATLAVRSNVDGEARLLPLAGIGTEPRFSLRPTVLDFGRQAVGGVSEAVEVTVINDGSAAGEVRRLGLTGPGSDRFRWLSNRCSQQRLVPGGDCVARLAFEPAGAGPVEARLVAVTETAELSLDVLGVGMAPGLWLDPPSVAFGDQRVGTDSRRARVTLENTGNAPLAITGLDLSTDSAFVIDGSGCREATLGPEERCAVTVGFRPRAEGDALGRLRISARGVSRPADLPLTGRGTLPRLAASGDRLELGRVQLGDEATSVLTLESVGTEVVRLTEVALAGGAGEISQEGTCRAGGRLAPGETCALRVRYRPGTEGSQSAVLRIGAADVDPVAVEVTGSGYAPPVARLAVSPERLEFPRLRAGQRSDILSLRVTSSGTARVRLAALRIEGEHSADFQMVPASCNGIPYLVPGSDCVVGFRFVPRAEGERRARIVIEHDGVAGRSTVSLAGFADPP